MTAVQFFLKIVIFVFITFFYLLCIMQINKQNKLPLLKVTICGWLENKGNLF